MLVGDNSSELTTALAFGAWADHRGTNLLFIRPGRPLENALIESFHGGRFRDEGRPAAVRPSGGPRP